MTQEELKPVGIKIKSLLEHTGLKQGFVAKQTGISAEIISRLVTGKELYCSEERVNKLITYLESKL